MSDFDDWFGGYPRYRTKRWTWKWYDDFDRPLSTRKLPTQNLPKRPQEELQFPDEVIVAEYERHLRDETAHREDWGFVNVVYLKQPRAFSIAECKEAWGRLLKKKIEASAQKSKLSVQIDDSSADDI